MNQFQVSLLELHKVELYRAIIPSQIIPHLATLLSYDEIRDIISLESRDRTGAVHKLLELLCSSRDNNWFKQFKYSLREAGYESLFKLMSCESVKDKRNFEQLIRSKLNEIISIVEPMQITLALLASNTITTSDAQLISAEQKNYGAQRGVITLLTLLPNRKETWFSDFIKALRNNKYYALVESIDPRLLSASTDDSLLRHCSNIRTEPNNLHYVYNPIDADGCYERDEKDSLLQSGIEGFQLPRSITAVSRVLPMRRPSIEGTKRVTSDSSTLNVSRQVMECLKSILPLKDPSFATSQCRVIWRDDITSADNETLRKLVSDDDVDAGQHQDNPTTSVESVDYVDVPQVIFMIMYCDDWPRSNPSSRPNSPDYCNSLYSSECGSTSSSESSGLSYDFVSDYGEESLNDHHITPNYPFGNQKGEKIEERSVINCSRIQACERNCGFLPSLTRMSVLGALQNNSTSISSIKKELRLYSYQEKVLEDMLDGENVMMCLPTGTGKTCVAIARAQRLLDACGADEPKIAFIVPTVALVEQQLNAFRTYLHGNWICAGLSPDMNEAAIPLDEVLARVDVIVMTPKILLNALEKKHIKSLSDFSLIFFDECHHTTKDHLYNKIMAEYYVDKILEEEQIEDLSVARVALSLPQIIGLTASPGVGKGSCISEVVDHILELCANLAFTRVSVVQYNSEEIINKSTESTIPIFRRLNDDFHCEISRVMQDLEKMLLKQESITNIENLRKVIQEIPNIVILLRAPPDKRGQDPYLQFISKLKRGVALTGDRELKKTTLSALSHLEIYNMSLIINEDCRTVDAVNYLTDHMQKVPDFSDTDRVLLDIYKKSVARMREISQGSQQDNPKLTELKRCILSCYENDKQSQGIVFCKTKEITSALVNLIKADPETSWLNPGILKGTPKSGIDYHYSKEKVEDALDHFRKGNHKLMFATTVAEEGLDIGQCNYVIRYECVTNCIGRTQALGRAREDQAQYNLVSDQIDDNSSYRIRESMMKKALQQVHDLPSEYFQKRVRELQHFARLKRLRGMAVEIEKNKYLEQIRRQYDNYELICIKCNKHCAFSSDIRVIHNTHYVHIDPDFRSKVKLEPYPTPKKISCSMEKKDKLFCKECGMEWGITVAYLRVVYPILKIRSFVIVDSNMRKSVVKKWKDVFFHIEEHSIEDMASMSTDIIICY